MIQPKKIRVAVLQGGQSGEHEVSLPSAANVVKYLDAARFEAIPVTIERSGIRAEPFFLGNHFDVVFPAVHGTLCEDGTLQGLLEQANLPYVGCGVLASALGMDKDVSKRLAREAGVAVGPYVVLRRKEWDNDRKGAMARVSSALNLPIFVKPANTGSSVGIRKLASLDALADAIGEAFQYDTKILIEQGIDARELELAVLESPDSHEPLVSVVGEIRPHHEFYSYAAKYLDEHGADLLVPAEIDAETTAEAQALAKKIFTLLECEGMARVDLFLERTTNKLWFNEINTLPGFTAISMYPRLMAAVGITYPELLTRLVELALRRHVRRKNLSREFAEGRALCDA